MSYDFNLFQPKAGLDVDSAAEQWIAEEEALVLAGTGPIDPVKEEQKRRLSTALINCNPGLSPFAFEYDKLAELEGITEEEARVRHRHIELNGAIDGNGIQIMLFDDSASITVPHRHTAEQSKVVFGEVWQYLHILEKEGGFRTFDPQLGRVLELSKDFDEVVSVYGRSLEGVGGIVGKHKQPKWKF